MDAEASRDILVKVEVRHQSQSKLWFVRPAGSYLLLLTAICAACLAPGAPSQQESHTVQAKILLSKLSIETPTETTSDLQNLLHDLLALEPAHLKEEVSVFTSDFLHASLQQDYRSFLSSYSRFERPPPSALL